MAIWKILRQRSNVELGSDRAEGERCTAEGHARRHGRRRPWRGSRRHEPGRAPRAGSEPVLPAGDDGREPVPLRRRRRPGAVDGSGEGRRTRPCARGRGDDAAGRRLHPRRSAARGCSAARDRRQDPRGVSARRLGGRATRGAHADRATHPGRKVARPDGGSAAGGRFARRPRVLPTRDRGGVRRGDTPTTNRQRRAARGGRGGAAVGHTPHGIRGARAVRRSEPWWRRSDENQLGIRSRQGGRVPGGEQGISRWVHGRSRDARSRVGHPGSRDSPGRR